MHHKHQTKITKKNFIHKIPSNNSSSVCTTQTTWPIFAGLSIPNRITPCVNAPIIRLFSLTLTRKRKLSRCFASAKIALPYSLPKSCTIQHFMKISIKFAFYFTMEKFQLKIPIISFSNNIFMDTRKLLHYRLITSIDLPFFS